MAFEFKFPDLGEGVHEGEIVRWLVSPGETVAAEQPLVEVMTDKVTAELPSPVGGTVVRLEGSPGDVVCVGSVLVTIQPVEVPGTAVAPGTSKDAPGREAEAETAPPGPADRGNGEQAPPASQKEGRAPLAVPAVRRLARELGVDLAKISATGPGGRVLESDVRAAAEQRETASPAAASGRTAARRIPLRGMRRVIAEHLLEGHRNTAPYTFVEEVDFTELVGVRERVRGPAEKAGVRMTYLPFIFVAAGMALREHPTLNATVDPENGDLVVHEEQQIGLAVCTDEGLVVPVIRNVERRNLLDLGREIEQLSQKARQGRLSREELQGGTFSVTSLGMLGGVMATPMLNTPQVAVLGVHRIALRPVVREGAVTARQMGNVSLTLDHRYIDGYAGAAFTQTLKGYLEDPAMLLFWLAELRGGSPG
jgi:pyruvate/2-oxoglutarate dehydrogenase complex dihydrolipoamide acyltransferase (E2) component